MQVGDLIDGKYQLVRLLGEGGMGAVFEARHTGIGRRVALKFLHSRLSNKREYAARFLREAQAAAAVGSEHIVAITDLGTDPEGAPYLVMEYLEGQDISSVLKREGPLDPARAARLIRQVCRGLGAAHSQGIVHRDLKPENLMLVRREDGAEWIKLLDFGIAKVRDALAAEQGQLTSSSTFLGTPHYMAPEQIEGASQVDHRADIYSTGVVLFEMLTGAPPFRADSLTQLLVMLTTSSPPPLRSVRPDLSPALEAIIARALARDPAHRFQSMDELSQALEPVAEGRAARVPLPTMVQGQPGIDALASTMPGPQPPHPGAGVQTAYPPTHPTPTAGSTYPPTHPTPQSFGGVTPPTSFAGATPAPTFGTVTTPSPGTGGLYPSSPGVTPAPFATHGTSAGAAPPPEKSRWWIWVLGLGVGLIAAAGSALVVTLALNNNGGGSDGPRHGPDGGHKVVKGDAGAGPDARPVNPPPACAEGKVASALTEGHCCWPGQSWSKEALACQGRPQCPAGMVSKGRRCICLAGQVASDHTDGHCCWPNQAWSKAQGRCVGVPDCPEGYWAAGEGCRTLPECPLGQVATAATMGNCCWPGQSWSGGACNGSISCPQGFKLAGTSCQPDDSQVGQLIQHCLQGKAAHCSDLGVRYELGKGVHQDSRRAAQLYGKACRDGNALGCHNLGVMYEHGRGVAQNHSTSAELYSRACQGGSAYGCTGLATAYHLGQGVAQDYRRAETVYRQACEQGQAHACGNLGTLYVDGDGLPRDLINGATYLRRACEQNNYFSCCSLGVLHVRGMGVAQDSTQARNYMQRACEGRASWACEWLRNPEVLGPIVPNHTYRAEATSVEGDAPMGEGAQCTLAIGFALGCGFNCRLRLTCGEEIVYGARASGYNRCRVIPSAGLVPSIEAHDSGVSPDDGDPRLDIWTAAGRANITDREGGVTWSATFRLTPTTQ